MIRKIKKAILETIIRMDEHNTLTASTVHLHQKTFLPYKNFCNAEKDIAVCGAGPSLQYYKPIKEAVHIAVNRAFLYEKVNFDFIFAQDFDGIRMVRKELIDYKPESCIKFLGATAEPGKKSIPESFAIECDALRFNMDYYIYRDGFRSKMVRDIDSRPLGGMPNVGMSVMQLALYMNPRKLYIVGCDMSGTHFADGNQSASELMSEKKQYDAYWEKGQKRLLDKWKEIKYFAEIYYPNTEIISINPVGLKGIFKDKYQNTEISEMDQQDVTLNG